MLAYNLFQTVFSAWVFTGYSLIITELVSLTEAIRATKKDIKRAKKDKIIAQNSLKVPL